MGLKKVDYQGFFAVEALPMTGARGGLEYIRMLERLWKDVNQKQAP